MYSVSQTSVGVAGVDAHRVPCCSSRNNITSITCRGKNVKKTMSDVRFRVSPSVCWNCLQVESVWGRRSLPSQYRIWDLFGVNCKRSRYCSQDLSPGSRQVVSVSPRVKAPTETLREDAREQSVLCSGFVEAAEVEDDVVALGYGWKVREATRFDTEELRAVAHVQASSFHIDSSVFDELFFKLFKAEVLSTLLDKAKHSPSDRYTCLLAEPATSMDARESGEDEVPPMIVGAVNLVASVDIEVLLHLHFTGDEYLYVSGMAVDINYRRKNVATLLLKACELLAMKWGFEYLALHAYEDDIAARTLYQRGGYRVVALDPSWMSTWVGRKRRVLMAKKTSRTPNFDF